MGLLALPQDRPSDGRGPSDEESVQATLDTHLCLRGVHGVIGSPIATPTQPMRSSSWAGRVRHWPWSRCVTQRRARCTCAGRDSPRVGVHRQGSNVCLNKLLTQKKSTHGQQHPAHHHRSGSRTHIVTHATASSSPPPQYHRSGSRTHVGTHATASSSPPPQYHRSDSRTHVSTHAIASSSPHHRRVAGRTSPHRVEGV